MIKNLPEQHPQYTWFLPQLQVKVPIVTMSTSWGYLCLECMIWNHWVLFNVWKEVGPVFNIEDNMAIQKIISLKSGQNILKALVAQVLKNESKAEEGLGTI